jgi:hypothetical protein
VPMARGETGQKQPLWVAILYFTFSCRCVQAIGEQAGFRPSG